MLHMFRELLNYCVTMTASSDAYSLALQHPATTLFNNSSFCSVNIFHRVRLGMLRARNSLNL